uniref:eIF-4F 25 kDa subunit n=1 Tax=Nicotiana tabacum TaxID=4097 RepID=A0A7H1JMP1_TOBAC|nr:eukaryotic translation initiation factor 4E1B-T [Nicotiana tabacum]
MAGEAKMAEESEKLRVDEVEVADDGPEEGEIVGESDDTVSHLSKEIKAKHPLENSWTFWFDNPMAKSRQAAWGSSLRDVYTFSTVEDFWGAYDNFQHPSKLVAGAGLYCFKHKIEPKWEDPICANGGKWTMSFWKGKSDTSWLYTVSIVKQWKEFLDYSDSIGFIVHDDAKRLGRGAKYRYTV